MKIFKTNTTKRGTYTYTFTNVDGNEEKVTLRPGENGITEADIKMLHSLDDSEVYYNLKNLRPERTAEEKATIKAWTEEYIKKKQPIVDMHHAMMKLRQQSKRHFRAITIFHLIIGLVMMNRIQI